MGKRSPAPDVHMTEQAQMVVSVQAVLETPSMHGMSMLDAGVIKLGVMQWKQNQV